MDAGTLNREVTISRPQDGSDDGAQPLLGFVDFVTVWANIKYPSGSETIRADAVTSVEKVSIRIRYRTDLDTSMRVRRGTTHFIIRAVLPDEVNQVHVDLVCEAISAVV